jgi:hypothetical protein
MDIREITDPYLAFAGSTTAVHLEVSEDILAGGHQLHSGGCEEDI